MNQIEKKYYSNYIDSIIYNENRYNKLMKEKQDLTEEFFEYIHQYAMQNKYKKFIDKVIGPRLNEIANYYRYLQETGLNRDEIIEKCNEIIIEVNHSLNKNDNCFDYYFYQAAYRNIDIMAIAGTASYYSKHERRVIYTSISHDYEVINNLLLPPDEYQSSDFFQSLTSFYDNMIVFIQSINGLSQYNQEIFNESNAKSNLYTTYEIMQYYQKRLKKDTSQYYEINHACILTRRILNIKEEKTQDNPQKKLQKKLLKIFNN